MRIIIDPGNPEIGTFCDMPCSIIRSEHATRETFAVVHDLNIQGVVEVRGFERMGGGRFLIAYPRLQPLDFSQGFDPASFLNQAIRTLDGLFAYGYVHRSISEGAFFRDSTDSVLLGRLEESIRASDDMADRVTDIAAVARIVEAHLSDDQRDPLLIDLLADMMCEDVAEVPRPTEILEHPFFWEAVRKLNLFKSFNDHLQHNLPKPMARLFEAKRDQVAGADWTVFLDRGLFMDASHYTTYSGRHMRDLIRLIRNKSEHEPHDDRGYRLAAIGTTKEDYFQYFHQRFPNLFLYTYYFAEMHARDCIPRS